MKDKTVLITGSTDGLGRQLAQIWASEGALILVHGRDGPRGESLVRAIENAGGRAQFYQADLSSLAEVEALAVRILKEHRRLDLLVNNAGIGIEKTSVRELSADGLEKKFAVNYLAGYLLTRRLLPLLKASAPSRVVNVTSVGQAPLDFGNLMLDKGYSGTRAYGQSKLAQILFTLDLAEELASSGVSVLCVHPATYMNTTMVREMGVAPQSSVDEGAEAVRFVATSPTLAGRTGVYFHQKRESRADAQAYDQQARRRLRAESERWIQGKGERT